MIFNGQYTYSAKGIMIDSMRYPASLDPLVKNGFWIGAEIPEALIAGKKHITVKVVPHEGHRGGPVFGIRTVKKE